MKESTIQKLIDDMNAIKNSGMSIVEYLTSVGKDKQNIYNRMGQFKSDLENIENHPEVITLYEEIKSQKGVNNTEERGMKVTYNRGKDGLIKSYSIYYPIKDSTPFETELNRLEVEQLFSLYSSYGGNFTARQVATEFPKFTTDEISKIFRCFKLRKSSIWVPPHLLEELSEEEICSYRMKIKEKASFKRADLNRELDYQKLIKKLTNEIISLKDRNEVLNILKNISAFDYPLKYEKYNNNSDIVIFLSDLHIGAYNEKESYIPLPTYDETEIIRRLTKVINYLHSFSYNTITICNLGDSVDSFNKQTTRGGHSLPTIISNKEQSEMYQKIMLWFFNQLFAISDKINYICTGESNHDGDWGWINNVLLGEKLKQKGASVYISNNPIDKFDINDTSIVFLHGKDNKNQFKGFPLTLNEKTENWFLNYFNDSKLTFKSNKCIVKGDLHQYSCTSAKTFDYISAPSLYATSNWIAANFGMSRWAVLAMEITSNNIIKQFLIKD